jgi:hypothetical protein
VAGRSQGPGCLARAAGGKVPASRERGRRRRACGRERLRGSLSFNLRFGGQVRASEARFIPAEREKGSRRGMNAPPVRFAPGILQGASCSGRAWNKNAKKKAPSAHLAAACQLSPDRSNQRPRQGSPLHTLQLHGDCGVDGFEPASLSNDIARSKSRSPSFKATW